MYFYTQVSVSQKKITEIEREGGKGTENMGWIAENVESIKSMKIRDTLSQLITLGMIVSMALIIWKALMCLTGSESPVVVVLSGSMEPAFKRGDILFLHMSEAPFRAGEIVVYNVEGEPIPIVHRVVEVHEQENTGKVDILTKGDANDVDDRGLYAYGQYWFEATTNYGESCWVHALRGWVTIMMTEKTYYQVRAYRRPRSAGYNLQGLRAILPEGYNASSMNSLFFYEYQNYYLLNKIERLCVSSLQIRRCYIHLDCFGLMLKTEHAENQLSHSRLGPLMAPQRKKDVSILFIDIVISMLIQNAKITVEQVHGLMSQVIKDILFNSVRQSNRSRAETSGPEPMVET
ncbi:hypothetical protein NC652_038986 [Populus alba x Populus x berolinensis]|nr:hypothetical protein NC652_038986 [Populus alba x Populus x berolinensis]